MALRFMFGLILASVACLEVQSDRLGLRSEPYPEAEKQPVVSSSQYCDFYSKKPNLDDGPCTEKDLDEYGHCNITQTCSRERVSHCYMSWLNDSGIVKIVSSGCWLKTEICPTECRAFNDTAANGVFYCCCAGDFCNQKFYLDAAIDTGVEEPGLMDEPFKEWIVVICILVSLFVLALLGIAGFSVWRIRTKALEDMDGVSVDTPATAATGCTTVSFPTPMELPHPELLEVKARGRFGKVWRAQLHDKLVAVKTFDLREKQSWQNEQDIFCTPLMTTHQNILKFLTASNRGEGMNAELWLITEFYERGSLADYLKVHTVTLAEALRILRTMACGLSFLHEDVQTAKNEYKPAIAHRDFKSKNVLLDQDLNAVIADFGLAVKFTPGESPGETHGQVGTLRYMAPEVLEGAINFQKDAFLRIDMYAFGLVAWEILTRCFSVSSEYGDFHLPFEAELGTHPTIDRMQEYVVEKKMRPSISEEWRRDKIVGTLCETMEECWDHDAEARLSAGCVELRVFGLLRQNTMMDQTVNGIQGQTPLIVNMPGPPTQSNYIDTEAMNQLNLRLNNLNNENKNLNQQMNGQIGMQTTNFMDGTQNPEHQNNKTQGDAYVVFLDDDHDSGTFANEDTLSHDGVMEQLIGVDNRESVPQVQVVDGDDDSATSLLTSDGRETDLVDHV